jgi:hypothetical protein
VPWQQRGPGELMPPGVLAGPPAADTNADLTVAEFLWAFRRDTLLPPAAPPPLGAATRAKGIAGLAEASGDVDPDVRWQSLWALARIGRHDAEAAARLRTRATAGGVLERGDVVAEVALVALGLCARDDADVLKALAARANGAAAPPRLRAFAFHALGLAAQSSAARATQFRVVTAAQRALLAPAETPPEVQVAALHSLALTRRAVAGGVAEPLLDLLARVFDDAPPATARPGAALDVRCHVPAAVAAIVDPEVPSAAAWRERFTALAERRDAPPGLARAGVLALGALCRPWHDASSPDAAYGQRLRAIARDARDLQARCYALVAMGDAGGAEHRQFLRAQLVRGGFLEQPWQALALAAAASKADTAAADLAHVEAALAGKRHPGVVFAMAAVQRVLRREPQADTAASFLERYGVPLPGAGAGDALVADLLATLSDAKQPPERRALAAMAIGHLADPSERHWSAALARAVDYRAATPVLLGAPNGVLRLP